jgi:hypothetical protein
MKTFLEMLQMLQSTPVPNLLIIAGFIFLLLAFVGEIGAIIKLPKERQRWAGIVGALLLILGVGLSTVPSSQPDSKSIGVAAIAPETATVVPDLSTDTPLPSTNTPMPTTTPTITPTPTPSPSSTPTVTPTLTPTSSQTPTTTPTLAPTAPLTPTLSTRVISNFEDGIQGWQAARLEEENWQDNETAYSVRPSGEAGYPSGALWGDFDFGRASANWPRATFYLTFPSGPEDWTSAVELRFDAKVLPETKGDIKATIVVKTRDDFCFNEHGEFQSVSQEWTSLTFLLHVDRYKTCEDPNEYDESPIAVDRTVELALVFIPSPDEARFGGAVSIDNVRLLEQP